MNSSYRHFYLYAKGHYQKTDLLDDMKQLVAKRCLLDKNQVRSKDVIIVLTNATEEQIKFDKFIFALWKNISLYKKENMITHLIQTMLSSIRFIKVTDLSFDLGKADPKILPLTTDLKE